MTSSTTLTRPKKRPAEGWYGEETNMAKLLGFVGSFVGSSIGWWLGARVGIMTAFMLSIVGTGAGIYLGRRIAAEL